MRLFLLVLASAVMLTGCAVAPKNLYANYRQDFGTYVAHREVSTFCLVPQLRFAIAAIEARFGRKVVVTSGYRNPWYNDKVGGADGSYHMGCMAADIFIPGVSKSSLIKAAYRENLVGGLGCHPGRHFIHIDVRARPRGWKKPVTWGC